MNKIIFFTLFMVVFSYCGNVKENSILKSGSLYGNSTYGLSDSEIAIKKNINSINKIQNNILLLSSKLDEMKNSTSHYKNNIDSYIDILKSSAKDLDNLKNEITILKKNYSDLNSKNIDLTVKVKDLNSSIIDILNLLKSSYVSKDDVKSSKDNFSIAMKYYGNKKYSTAIKYFRKSLKSKNKIALNYYYIGNIKYIYKKYDTAIFYYKKSLKSNYKGRLVSKVLYQIVLSFMKLNDNTNVKIFKKLLLNKYPNSKESKLIKKHIYKEIL